jgi:hypothetical protein
MLGTDDRIGIVEFLPRMSLVRMLLAEMDVPMLAGRQGKVEGLIDHRLRPVDRAHAAPVRALVKAFRGLLRTGLANVEVDGRPRLSSDFVDLLGFLEARPVLVGLAVGPGVTHLHRRLVDGLRLRAHAQRDGKPC